MPFTRWHFGLGLNGLALLRTAATATDAELDGYTAELARPRPRDPALARVAGGGVEHGVAAGYARWAPVYDSPGNPLIALEEPVVREILAAWPPGSRVLDAACGTGRHTVHLAALGHDVTGTDRSPEMLATAAAKNAKVQLVRGSTDALPFPTGSFDAAVCALLFDHLLEIDATVGELARVVRPGGRLLISNIHPTMALIGAHASFRDADDEPHFMRSNHHSVPTYLRTFRDRGLTVVECAEACWDAATARAKFPFVSEELALAAVVGIPMALIWELEV